ncbi:hypothetical protein [Pseudoclavibacter soli]|uniref:hypothetical protein n=1 Tax=Pseudoclavibacter soli TaxID=452623 RepID=UPI0004176FB1|nr:hypothetical protein [Pseudoclavibacter soli]
MPAQPRSHKRRRIRIRPFHARSIRLGIRYGRLTRYGELDDPYYRLRSKLLLGPWVQPDEDIDWGLAEEAFRRTRISLQRARLSAMSPAEQAAARDIEDTVYRRYVESSEQRRARQQQEELDSLRHRVATLEARALSTEQLAAIWQRAHDDGVEYGRTEALSPGWGEQTQNPYEQD